MRNFIILLFLSVFINLSSVLKAHNVLNYSLLSEESSKITISKKNNSTTHSDTDIKPKNIAPKKQKTARETTKEQRKIKRQQRKELRKTIWKSLKKQRKINKEIRKENRKKGIKDSTRNIHWAAYVAFFGAILALGIFVGAIAVGTMYAIFSYLLSLAILLLPVSIISGIIGVSVALNDDNEKFDKTYTLALALVGGILSLLMLLFIILLILALSAAF